MLLKTSGSRFLGVPTPMAFFLVFLLAVILLLHNHVPTTAPEWPDSVVATSPGTASLLAADRPLTFIVTENQMAHDEVVAPLVQAFSAIPGANITGIFLSRMDRFGSFEMYNSLQLPIQLPTPRQYQTDMIPFTLENPPDFIIASSCGYDSFDQYEPLLQNCKTHIFCVVHHADNWKDWFFGVFERKLGPWVQAERVDFITLSPHVAKSLPDSLLAWKEVKWLKRFPPIHTFPPVFSFSHNEPTGQTSDEIGFALQGNYQEGRRNFTRVFQGLERAKDLLKNAGSGTSIKLHLVGSGEEKPSVPDGIQDMVQFDENLNYTEFYKILGAMTAILPAFADEGYFTSKASSSVPASLIAGSPLVATRRLLNAYTYIDESTVWLQQDDQSDFDVLWEVVRKPRAERENKMRAARDAASAVIQTNKVQVARWVEAVLAKRMHREQV